MSDFDEQDLPDLLATIEHLSRLQDALTEVDQAPEAKQTPVMIQFDAALLARVDRAARRRGVSRSAWVAFTLKDAGRRGTGVIIATT
jgi:hypothetical protein